MIDPPGAEHLAFFSGLVHNRARVLHPRMGRFMQRDPLNQNQPGGGYQDGMNLYQYVRSNPALHRDPTGLYSSDFGRYDPSDPEECEKKNCIHECGYVACYIGGVRLKEEAIDKTKERFPGVVPHNNPADAWRHCYWSCRMAQEIGVECAKYIGDQHEERNIKEGQLRNESDMDYHNNHIGRGLGVGTKIILDLGGSMIPVYLAKCEDLCEQALKDGKLQTKP